MHPDRNGFAHRVIQRCSDQGRSHNHCFKNLCSGRSFPSRRNASDRARRLRAWDVRAARCRAVQLACWREPGAHPDVRCSFLPSLQYRSSEVVHIVARSIADACLRCCYLMHRTTACPLMPRVVLPEVHCIAIEGPDARRFAQAQFSGDVESLAQGRWQWNAWLDARGRVQALMQLGHLGQARYLAILRGGDAEKLRADLGRYLLRTKATVVPLVFSGVAGDAMPAGQVATDGAIVFGYGDRSLRLEPPGGDADAGASNAWRLADIRLGWPTLPHGDALFLPPALGLERLGALSLDKGCYPGQEIVARLHYRGGHKSGLCHVRGPNWLEPGSTFDAEDIGPVRVLECAIANGSAEALMVAPKSDSLLISILDHKFDVVSKYDA